MRRAALALLVLAPLALAACGGGSKKNAGATELTPVAYVKQAAHKTAAAASEHMTLKGTVAVQGQVVTVSGGGNFDNASKTGAMHVDFNVGGLTGGIDEIIHGTTIYMKSPLFSAVMPSGKSWMKIDLQRALQSRGIDFSTLGSQDPTTTLAQLQRIGTVTEVGDEDVGGTATTHYRAHIDLAKAQQGARIKALTNATYGPIDVWIGKDDGLVRRLKLVLSVAPNGAAEQTISITTEFSDFGKAVRVALPAASETFDATNASLKGLGS
jgi:uncharacterized protein YdeI (BOF family)